MLYQAFVFLFISKKFGWHRIFQIGQPAIPKVAVPDHGKPRRRCKRDHKEIKQGGACLLLFGLCNSIHIFWKGLVGVDWVSRDYGRPLGWFVWDARPLHEILKSPTLNVETKWFWSWWTWLSVHTLGKNETMWTAFFRWRNLSGVWPVDRYHVSDDDGWPTYRDSAQGRFSISLLSKSIRPSS